jgi:hypothetical protein
MYITVRPNLDLCKNLLKNHFLFSADDSKVDVKCQNWMIEAKSNVTIVSLTTTKMPLNQDQQKQKQKQQEQQEQQQEQHEQQDTNARIKQDPGTSAMNIVQDNNACMNTDDPDDPDDPDDIDSNVALFMTEDTINDTIEIKDEFAAVNVKEEISEDDPLAALPTDKHEEHLETCLPVQIPVPVASQSFNCGLENPVELGLPTTLNIIGSIF